MERMILHVAIADFLVAAAQRFYPQLAGKPFVVAPPGHERAKIRAVSGRARRFGVRKNMPVKAAQKRCRGLVVHPFEERFFSSVSNELTHLAANYSPVIEPHFGRLFIEIISRRTQHWQYALEVALRLQKDTAA